MTRVFAAADIGSNTAHLLVAATDGDLVMRLDNYNEWIPLGETVARTGQIPREMAGQLASAVKEFRSMAKAHGAERLYVFATEAMRRAENHDAILKRIRDETGVEVEIITPQRETELSHRGIQLDHRHLPVDTLFEIGGGSLQIGRIEAGMIVAHESHPLGTGRLIADAELRNPCPPEARDRAYQAIARALDGSELLQGCQMAVASGGVARGLWRALHPDGDKTVYREELEYLAWVGGQLTIDRLITRFNVKQKRAGTLLPGALVYAELLRRANLASVSISEFGIREGAVREMASTVPVSGKARKRR